MEHLRIFILFILLISFLSFYSIAQNHYLIIKDSISSYSKSVPKTKITFDAKGFPLAIYRIRDGKEFESERFLYSYDSVITKSAKGNPLIITFDKQDSLVECIKISDYRISKYYYGGLDTRHLLGFERLCPNMGIEHSIIAAISKDSTIVNECNQLGGYYKTVYQRDSLFRVNKMSRYNNNNIVRNRIHFVYNAKNQLMKMQTQQSFNLTRKGIPYCVNSYVENYEYYPNGFIKSIVRKDYHTSFEVNSVWKIFEYYFDNNISINIDFSSHKLKNILLKYSMFTLVPIDIP
jgi:hypothetical protein